MKGIETGSSFIRKNVSTVKVRHCSAGIMAILLATSLVACGGGGGSSGGGGNSPSTFSVTSVTPEDGDAGVELDAILKASFNRDLLASSATEDSDRILLKKSSGFWEVPAPVSVSIDTASSLIIQPDTPLDILSEYIVTVTSDITDNSGHPLSDEHHWRFVTRDGDWEEEARIGSGSAPDIAVDVEGNGWAVWLEEGTDNVDVVGRYYSVTDGAWKQKVAFSHDPNNLTDASKPRIAMDRNSGDALAVWTLDGNVYARHWDADSAPDQSGWSTVEKISGSNPAHERTFLEVVFSESNARAVWIEKDAGSLVLAHNQYWAPNGAWDGPLSGPELNADFTFAEYADFAADNVGNALLLWINDQEPSLPEADNRVYATRYDAQARSWVSTTAIENAGVKGRADAPKVAFDNEGNAFAAWWRSADDFFGRLYVSRFDADSGAWSGSTRIMGAREESEGRYPSIAVDQKGNAMVAFELGEPYAARYNADEGAWGDARRIGDYGGAPLTDIVIDHDGNATVVWRTNEGAAYNILSNRYAAVTDSWGTPKRVETGGGGSAKRPVIDNAGWNHDALSVWEDAGSIYTNRFSAE